MALQILFIMLLVVSKLALSLQTSFQNTPWLQMDSSRSLICVLDVSAFMLVVFVDATFLSVKQLIKLK